MSQTLTTSQQFGRYKIIRLLGAGAMGSVYLARDIQLERDVALKVPQFEEGKEPQILERFYQEARAAATIHHPNVCPVFDVGEIDGVPYLTMAFIEGKPLEEWVTSGKPVLTERQIATIGRKVADALSEAHKKGVLHRDLKPANIMIDKRGEPIVMDFGLAQRARNDNTRLTRFGAQIGSPAYMSPEQIKGETNTTGPATDIFSLGVILYELLARRLPFDGDSIGAVHAQILMEEPPPLRKFCPDLSPVLEAICLKALAKRAEDRHASMAQMSAAIRNFLNGPAVATPREIARPAAPPPESKRDTLHGSAFGGRSMVLAQQEEREAQREQPKRKKKRKKDNTRSIPGWALLSGTGVLVVAVLVGLALIFHDRNRSAATTEKTADTGGKPLTNPHAGTPTTPVSTDFHNIFNGKDLAGWKVESGDAHRWHVDAGREELRFEGGTGEVKPAWSWLVTEKHYGDFLLDLEFQLGEGTDSGISIRHVPDQQVQLEVQLRSNSPEELKTLSENTTGALCGVAIDHAPVFEPAGKWNKLEVAVQGQTAGIKVNGKETVSHASLLSPKASRRIGRVVPQSGAIGLQGWSGSIKFRHIRVKELPPSQTTPIPEPEAHALFDGMDYRTDWEPGAGTPPNAWRVERGELVSVGVVPGNPVKESMLLTKRDYKDFVLTFDFLTSQGGLSGVTPRAIVGQEMQIGIPVMDDSFPRFREIPDPTQTLRTGAVRFVRIDKQAVLNPLEQWNTMEIRVHWPHVRVVVNGQETVTTSLEAEEVARLLGKPLPQTGRIGLLNSMGTVRYRNIKIMELSPKSLSK